MKCDVKGSDPKLQGPTGKEFRVECSKNCAKYEGGQVIGSMIYMDDSSVCKAAIHAG